MKKNLFIYSLIGLSSVSLFATSTNTYADSNKTDQKLSITVKDGSLKTLIPKEMEATFPEIEPSTGGVRYYHPTIKQSTVAYSTPPVFYNSDSSINPFENPPEFPPVDPEPFPGPPKDAIVRIDNSKLGNPDFKVSVKRTPFVNTENGAAIEGIHLFMGNFNDRMDFFGDSRSNEAGSPDSYWLTSNLTIEESNETLVADYRGEAARGQHWLSPFTPDNLTEDGYLVLGPEAIDPELQKEHLYEEKNISLAVDKNTHFPSAGNYESTVTWSIQLLP
ncbi:hypothetical protein OL233_04320 [Vagococcus sp. PNs007]|uniref:WxL domain-containing protein n=1 Tax=Vagococcus proximus TaxID=2991417 RepID=A0ABT5X0H3_9ENTE|nr:hypothetical protein [Vagococcus proximus]MDF0479507.1 hypothetical protein [Vagococcus proximus]